MGLQPCTCISKPSPPPPLHLAHAHVHEYVHVRVLYRVYFLQLSIPQCLGESWVMSLFGRIKSAVVGNPVTKEYELGRHIASAGPGLMWKVYSAAKKSTRQVCKYTYMYAALQQVHVYRSYHCFGNWLFVYNCTVHVHVQCSSTYIYSVGTYA